MKYYLSAILVALGSPVLHAGLITHSDYNSGSVITAAGQNANENVVFNEFNGNIQDVNVNASAAIQESKLKALGTNQLVTTDVSGVMNTGVTGVATSSASIQFVNNATEGIVGTTAADNALAGNYGEYVSSDVPSAAAVTMSVSGAYTNVAQISISTGDWDVSGMGTMTIGNASATSAKADCAVSQFSGDTSTDHVLGDNVSEGQIPVANVDTTYPIAAWRKNSSQTLIIYLKCRLSFSGGNPKAYGRISARRAR